MNTKAIAEDYAQQTFDKSDPRYPQLVQDFRDAIEKATAENNLEWGKRIGESDNHIRSLQAELSAAQAVEHKAGCPAQPGYGHPVESCICGATQAGEREHPSVYKALWKDAEAELSKLRAVQAGEKNEENTITQGFKEC